MWPDSRLRVTSRYLIALACLGLAAPARAEIALSPLRQVITNDAPAAVYQVSNPSGRIIEGRVGWIDLAATETGYRNATPDERAKLSAAPYLTVWPASFRLEPGAKATVTVKLRNGVRTPKGERRSHLLIETAALRTPFRKASGSLELDIGIGVSTPVILRGAGPGAAAHFGDTRLLRNSDGLLELETHVHADSAMTAYGRVDIVMRGARDAPNREPALLGRIDNVAAYADAGRRRVIAPLQVEHLPPGTVEIRFIGGAEFEGVVFAERSFEIAAPH